jgi:hypothetical protein
VGLAKARRVRLCGRLHRSSVCRETRSAAISITDLPGQGVSLDTIVKKLIFAIANQAFKYDGLVLWISKRKD